MVEYDSQFKRIWYLLDKILNPAKVPKDSHFLKKVKVLQRWNKIGDALNEVGWWRLMSRGPPHESTTSFDGIHSHLFLP